MAEETEFRPKPMVEIGGKPILWHIMRHYLRYGSCRFAVALGYKGEQIKRYFVEYPTYGNGHVTVDMRSGNVRRNGTSEPASGDWIVDLIETGETTETGARMRRLAPYLADETFMLTYGDGVSDIDLGELVRFHRSHGKLATMSVVRPPSRFGEVTIDADRVDGFVEKPGGDDGPRNGEGWINAGFFVLEPGIFDYIDDDDSTRWELEPLERLAKDGELMAYRHDSFWQCMDTRRDKMLLESLWNAGDPPWTL
jgi:glucose-1-phosphate cytidylyltransferase